MSSSPTRCANRTVSPIANLAGSKASNAIGAAGLGIRRVHAADDPEVHQDRVVAAEERLPGPERVALAGREVIRVDDHDLPPVGGWRIRVPAGGRHLRVARGSSRVPRTPARSTPRGWRTAARSPWSDRARGTASSSRSDAARSPSPARSRFTVSITQYCHSVESPHSGTPSSPRNPANSSSTAPPPDDSFATSHSTFGWSWTVSITLRMYASWSSWIRGSSGSTWSSTIEPIATPLTLFFAWNGWPSTWSGARAQVEPPPLEQHHRDVDPPVAGGDHALRGAGRSRRRRTARGRTCGLPSIASPGPVRAHGCGSMQRW